METILGILIFFVGLFLCLAIPHIIGAAILRVNPFKSNNEGLWILGFFIIFLCSLVWAIGYSIGKFL